MAKATTKAELREQTGQNKVFGMLQQLGQTFMLPISLLPVAGLLLGIGSSFTNPTVIEMYNLGGILHEGTFLFGFLSILADAGNVIFGNLGLLFGISVASGLAKTEKGVASLSAIIGYFVMYATMTSTLHNFRDVEALSQVQGLITNYLGFENTMNLGVIGGISIGLIVANLHNRYYTIELPEALSFFGGTHFIPIASSLAGVALGIIMAFVWPIVSYGFSTLGGFISGLGIFGIFLYVYIYRALIPFGLHHVFYLPFWQTAIGGTAVVNGETIVGAQNIVFAQLAAGVPIDSHAAAHFSYMFPVMLFGIPAACIALYQAAYPERKADVRGFYTSSGLTCFATGITEPIEFAFVFASPAMYYGVHCVLYGISGVLVYLLGAGVGLTFSGGVIDFVLYGILPGNHITGWVPVLLVGLAFFFLYYFIFRWGVNKFDWKVPGREDDLDSEALVFEGVYEDLNEREQRAYRIVSGLGGANNLDSVSNCATRLRVKVKDGSLVNESILKGTGSSAVVVNGDNVQVVYGTTVSNVKTSVDQLIDEGKAPREAYAGGDDLDAETEVHTNEGAQTTENLEATDLKVIEFLAPASGQIVDIHDVDDPVFGQGLMGEGFAIQPTNGEVHSPIAGEVMMVFDTKHAIGIKNAEGLEILIHMGIDTVALNGSGFTVHVQQGDQISAGQALADMDLAYITEEGKATDIIVAMTNSQDVLVESMLKRNESVNLDEKIGDVTIR
ncbi:PTS glucose transporter subunit IIABC [Suicoccus acidiformans]|uniref:PTS glucose transporter subunit IIABC n=1 Tax=Suicoccus acidiformans TaxID=2036206 RepID=A0A347WKD7_9LACT|nr:PTS transporter subunit IIABC [Suicoccus acidiformans]AXY25544.1 PTS glucose transporter subunit IIABC [Suicoccus acidiformans]